MAAIFVAISIYLLSNAVNEYRMTAYVGDVSEGFFTLVANNIAAKPEPVQQQWLAVIQRLSGLKIHLQDQRELSLSEAEKELLLQQKPVIHADIDKHSAKVFYSVSVTSNKVLSLTVHDINEQLARVAGLLVVNELQRHDYNTDERLAVFSLLKQQFSFPLALIRQHNLALDATQLRLLQRGEMVISVSENAFNVASIKVYSPTDVLDEVLVVGPIPMFDWAPRSFIISHVLLGVLLFAITVYILLRPLQLRLRRMGLEIENIDLSQNQPPMTIEGGDMLSLFSQRINTMAGKIQSLMKAQRELTQAVSHELRTPIARMKFHLALMDDLAISHTEEKHLKGIKADIKVLETLVDEILTYAQLEQEQPHLNIVTFDLALEIHQMIKDVQAMRPDIGIHFSNHDVYGVEADQHYLLRACLNLIVNAQRHARHSVEVNLCMREGDFCISVHDDGEGIADADKADIFTPFKRVDSSRNRKSGGHGLGLAIVFEIMRWHRGTVELCDSPLGGCEFILRWNRGRSQELMYADLVQADAIP